MQGNKGIMYVVLAVCAFLMFGQAQLAGQQRRAPRQHGPDLERLAQSLGLSEEQKGQLQQIGREQAEQVRAIREDDSLTNEEKRAKIQELNTARQDRFRGILTAEQQEKFGQMRQRRGRRSSGRGPRAGPGFGRFGEGLDLSEEQREQIEQTRTEHREQIQVLREDQNLSPEERRARMQELRQNRQGRMREILTAEQQERLSQRREQFGTKRRGHGGRGRR